MTSEPLKLQAIYFYFFVINVESYEWWIRVHSSIFGFLKDRLLLYSPSWPETCDPPASEMTFMHYHAQLQLCYDKFYRITGK